MSFKNLRSPLLNSVIALSNAGLGADAVAQELGCSKQTVYRYRSHARQQRKLGEGRIVKRDNRAFVDVPAELLTRFDRMCDGQDMTAPALARALLVSLSQKPDLVAHLIGHRKG